MKNNYYNRIFSTSNLFFACILCFLLAGVSTTVNAQSVIVSGSTLADGTYTTMGLAFSAINAQANQSGKNIEIKLSGNIVEDQNNGSTLNAGNWTTLKIYPTATTTITGPINLGGSVIKLNGADNVTIDGRINQTGATIELTIQALSSNTVNVISFINSAIFNTIKFCRIKGKSNNDNCGQINFATSSSISGNSNNTIDNCEITSISDTERSVYGIYSEGSVGYENSSNTISNNKFFNFGNNDRLSSAIYIKSASNSFNINGNHFYQPITAPSSSYAIYYIKIDAGSDYSISSNYMGGVLPFCGGTAPLLSFSQSGNLSFCPIYLNVGKDYPTSVQNNTIQNLNITCADPAFSAIYVAAGAVNITGNTIGSSTIAQSIKINSSNQNDSKSTYVIKIKGADNVYIKNNIIGGIFTSSTNFSKPHSLYAIYKGFTYLIPSNTTLTTAAGNLTVTGNTIGSETVSNSMYASCAASGTGNGAGTDNTSNAQQLVGIYTVGTDINLINENTIANLNNANTYYNSVDNKNNLAIYTTGGSNTIKDNIIHDITTPMYFVGGIYQASNTASNIENISNNTIYNLYNTNASAAVKNVGIYSASATGITSLISANYIYGLKVASTDNTSAIEGIDLMSGTNNCYNNIVNIGVGVSQATRLYGIYDNGATGCINNIYHNTVYIGGSTTLVISRTSAFFRESNAGTANVRNNIFRNSRTGGSVGKHYAAYIVTNKNNLTIDFNDYFVDGANSAFGYLNGTALTSTTILTNLGTNSKVDIPLFTSAPTTLATDFRLTAQMAGTNTLLTTVPTDFEGITRTIPTMGAWENGFVSLAPSRYFTYIVGKGPSAEQMFIIKASGLTADMTIAPPADFEISTVSGGIFTLLPITIKHTGGIINDTIYIRLKAGLTVGPYGPENIALTSGATQNVVCNGYVIPAVVAGGGGSYCDTEPIKLTSTTSGGVATNTFWNGPNNYYSTAQNPQIAPPLTAANAGTYTVTTSYIAGTELIVNGGFEDAGTQPVSFTNDYTYKAAVTTKTDEVWLKDTYTITDIPYNVHYDSRFGRETDYTTTGPHGGSKQMVVNGSGKVAWRQQVTLEPYSTYQLSFWLLNVTGAVTPAKIYVDGLEISPIYSAPSTKGQWSQVIYNLPMANVTSVKLELTNVGNSEFGLDDISLKKVYTSSSSVDVSVIVGIQAPNVAITATPGTTVDAGTSITFTATPYNGGTAPTYQWNLNGTPITGATGVTYTYVPINGDEISCTMTSTSNCKTTATVTSTKITMTVNSQRNFWKGNYNTNWWDNRNWTATKVPEEGEAVAFSKGTPYGDAQRDLILDKDRIIGSFTNKVSGLKLIIPAATYLTVNGAIDTDSDPSRILVKAYPGGTQQNGSLYFPNATNVYGTVEMWSKASYNLSNPVNNKFFWQYFGIPIETTIADNYFYGAYIRLSWEPGNDDAPFPYYWKELSTYDPVTPFLGYELCQENPTTYSFSGKLVKSDFNPTSLAKTTGAKYPGEHLFSNPYTTAINVDKIEFGDAMDKVVFLYNTGSYGQWNTPGYQTLSGNNPGQYLSIPQNVAGFSGIPGQIPSMSSFLVKTSADPINGSYIKIKYNDASVKNTTLQRAKAKDGVTNSDLVSTRIDLTGEHYNDKMWIFTEPSCTKNFDNGWDGRKMLGSTLAPQIYAIEADGDYQVNSVNDMHNTDLAFQAGDELEYTLKFTHENIQRVYAGVYLVDLIENKTVDISISGSTYTFATEQSEEPAKRFKIITRKYEKDAPDADSSVKIFSSRTNIYIQNSSSFNGESTLYDITGRMIREINYGPNTVIEAFGGLKPGAYVVGTLTNGEKVSKRIIVQ